MSRQSVKTAEGQLSPNLKYARWTVKRFTYWAKCLTIDEISRIIALKVLTEKRLQSPAES